MSDVVTEDGHEEGEIVEEGKNEQASSMEVENSNGDVEADDVNNVNKGEKRSRSEEKESSSKKAKKEHRHHHHHRHHHKSDKHRTENGSEEKEGRKREREEETEKRDSSKRRKPSENGDGDHKERERSRPRDSERNRSRTRDSDRDGDRRHERDHRQRDSDRDRNRNKDSDRDRNRDSDRERDRRQRELERERREKERQDRIQEERERRQKEREEWEKDRARRERERNERHRLARGEPPMEKQEEEPEEKKKTPEELKREEEEYQRKVELALKKRSEEENLQKIQEDRKKRREAIMAKYKKDQEQKTEEPAAEVKPEVKEVTVQEEKKDLQPIVSNGSNHQEGQTVKLEGEKQVEKVEPLKMKPPLENEPDKFATVSDMFSDVPTVPVEQRVAADGGAINQTLDDNWDDEEGYYCLRVGEILNGKYRVFAGHGKGVFSTVLRAKTLSKGEDGMLEEGEEVAIKVIRNNETMYRAGVKERDMLKLITNADPNNKKHCIRLLNSFMHRNHLCLVLEPMHMDMREVIKKYGRDIGITIMAVKIYAKQLFVALKHLKSLKILHADLKPDNIVTNQQKTVLKVCDLGSASSMDDENPITPYLVSRFYRAPEITLGLPYDYAIDVWAAGCCFYEMYTGKICFPGKTNNEMLKFHMQVKGMFSRKMLRKGKFWTTHFDEQSYAFLDGVHSDPTREVHIKKVPITGPTRDLRAELLKIPHEAKEVQAIEDLADLLEQCFNLNPQARITPELALHHPFFQR